MRTTQPKPEHPEDRLQKRLVILVMLFVLATWLTVEYLPAAFVNRLAPLFGVLLFALSGLALLLRERSKIRTQRQREEAEELGRMEKLRDTLGPTNMILGNVSHSSVMQAGRVDGGVHVSSSPSSTSATSER
jgi:hypothetical protein